MCGIAGFYVKDSYDGQYDLEKLADNLLLSIEHRGMDATGYFAAAKGGASATLKKDNIPASYFTQLRDFLPKDIKMFLGHTRLATQGRPEQNENNHPVNFRTCFATHNGVIYNDRSIIDDIGEERVAEVDSIAVPMLVAHCGFHKALEHLPKLEGSWALAIADPIEAPDELLLVRGNSSPLVVLDTKHLLIWASEQSSIIEAFGDAIGTPPDSKKFDFIQEGEAVTINKDGDIKTETFMEPQHSWRNRSHYNWYTDSKDSYGGYTGSTGYSTTAKKAEDKVLCFECGERTAYFHITDGYESEGRWYEFDVPVCYQCEQDLYSDPKNLSWRYATTPLKIRTRKMDERCYWCNHNTATRFDSMGDAACDYCKIGDSIAKDSKKNFATFKGSESQEKMDNVLELRPGDPIPTDMIYAFGDCDACQSAKPAVIGADGFAICWECRQGEMLVAAANMSSNDVAECYQCEATYPSNEVKDTVFGPACRPCRFGMRSRDAASCESDSDTLVYKACKDCKEYFDRQMLVDTTDGLFCKVCVDKDQTPLALEPPRPNLMGYWPNLMGYMREADSFFDQKGNDPLSALEVETARSIGYYDRLVGWVLRFCTVDMLVDPPLKELWEKATDKYEELLKEATK